MEFARSPRPADGNGEIDFDEFSLLSWRETNDKRIEIEREEE